MSNIKHDNPVSAVRSIAPIVRRHINDIFSPFVLDLIGLYPVLLRLGYVPVLLSINAIVPEVPHIIHWTDPGLKIYVVATRHNRCRGSTKHFKPQSFITLIIVAVLFGKTHGKRSAPHTYNAFVDVTPVAL